MLQNLKWVGLSGGNLLGNTKGNEEEGSDALDEGVANRGRGSGCDERGLD